MNRADAYLTRLTGDANNPDAGDEYLWAADGDIDRDGDGFNEADCSGERHAALKAAGYADERTTAEGYRERGHKIDKPTELGDYGVLLNSDGTAHHIVMYVGGNHIIEAKGHAYGIVWSTVEGLNDRGAVWYRDDKVNAFLGHVTTAPKYRVGLILRAEVAHGWTVAAEKLGLVVGRDIFSKAFVNHGPLVAWAGIFPDYSTARRFMEQAEAAKLRRYAKPIITTDVGASEYLGQLIKAYKP